MKATFVLLLLLGPILGMMRFQAPGRSQQSSITSDSEDKKICVLGNVIRPSLLQFRVGITVTQAIKEAGGIPPHNKSKKARVYSQTTEGTSRIIYVDLETLRRKPYMDLELQSFDTVEVLFGTKKKKFAAAPYNPCFSRSLKGID